MKTNRLTKTLIGLFSLILLIGCEENLSELIIKEEQGTEGLELFRGNMKDFPELGELFQKTVIEKKVQASKEFDNELYDFVVDESSVSMIMHKDDIFYSFAILRENGADNVLENLAISNKDGEEPLAYIVSYYPDDAYLERFEQNPNTLFSGQRSMVPLDTGRLTFSIQNSGCFTISTTYCTYDGHEDNEFGIGVAGPACTDTYTATTTVCLDAGDSSGGDGGNSGSGNSGGGSGGNGSSGDGTGGQNNNPLSDLTDSTIITTLNVPFTSVLKERMGYSTFSEEARWINRQQNWPIVEEMVIFLNRNQNSNIAKDRVDDIINGYTERTTLSAFPYVKYPDDKDAEYRRDFKELTKFLENEIPKIAANEKIIDAIHELTEAPKSIIKEALEWGKGPEIVIEQLGGEGDQEQYGAYRGHLDPTKINKIFLDIDLANDIENLENSKDFREAISFLIAVTILHEYNHLGDFVFSNSYWGDLFLETFEEENEVGIIFEREVFGQSVWRSNVGVIMRNFRLF